MKRLGLLAPITTAALAAAALFTSDAHACGGCFVPPTDTTVVTGHRMAVSISPTQTVLWDQIQYAGDPAAFAWVLPVRPGTFVEVASNAWFEVLDAATSVQVVQPPVTCKSSFGFGGCGAADSGGSRGFAALAEDGEGSSGGVNGPPVTVIHRDTVGPYETVTLSTDTPGALNTWLTEHNYNIDPSTQPLIDQYVAEGFDFVALHLLPDKGVREMKPVRVVFPGSSFDLPLRMVAVGTGANVAVTLFVISEGRMEADNFPNVRVPVDLVAWDFADSSSNYGELRAQTLKAAQGGSAWLSAYAQKGSLLTPVFSPIGFGGNVSYGISPDGFSSLDTIAEAFLNQGILNKETAFPDSVPDEQACRDSFSSLEMDTGLSGAVVKDPCPADVPPNSDMCGMVPLNEIDARIMMCGALDDLGVALTGMHPKDVWLTRLEASLPQEALKKDLVLRAAKSQEPVSNFITARVAVNADQFCGSTTAPPLVWPGGGGGTTGMLVGFGAAALALGAALARRSLRARA